MADTGSEPVTDPQQRRAALRARDLLGPEEVDALTGARAPEDAANRLLANRPVVTGDSVQDGLDLLRHQQESPPTRAGERGSRWVPRDDAAQAQHALRWAAGREGQLERGLPMVSPIRNAGVFPLVLAVLCWVMAPIALLVLWIILEGGPDVLVPWGAALALVALGARWFWLSRQLKDAATVADEHLFVLRPRKDGLPVDAATALTEQFLVIHKGALGVIYVDEWTAYPLTVALSEEALQFRVESARRAAKSQRWTVPDVPQGLPIIIGESADHLGKEHTPTGARFAEEYAGGWLVAEVRLEWMPGPAWIIVRENPERFAEEVLPLCGDRAEFEPGSLRVLDQPERVPSDRDWVDDWVKSRS